MQVSYYTMIGSYAGATMLELKECYRQAVWRYHPDRVAAGATTETQRHFADIATAYKTLRDPAKRVMYDALQAMSNDPCQYCVKGAVYKQSGFHNRVVMVCLRCNGSGLKERIK